MATNQPVIEGQITQRVQFFSLLGSIFLLLLIIQLIRKGYLKAGYSILWFLVAGAMIVLSLSANLLLKLAEFIGVFYAPAALFLVLLVGVILMAIHFSTIFTKQEKRIKKLTQEIALLKERLEKSTKK